MSERKITWEQLSIHIKPHDCWILIDGSVYDVSDFIVQHPGGDQPLLKNSGLDGTQFFDRIGHSEYAISLRNARKVGQIINRQCPEGHVEKVKSMKDQRKKQEKKQQEIRQQKAGKKHPDTQADFISREVVKRHNTESDCWLIVDGKVCDVTQFLPVHPGGSDAIMQYAGKNATQAFKKAHKFTDKISEKAILKRDSLVVGVVRKNPNIPLVVVVATILIIAATYICTHDI